eukprot:GFUD01102869.1.p1 GENE.GFUD01102869.1~~GFUD01102869.1.p1  ORF type:complete len:359 (-),score=130.53 GFUD01102869.1:112-1188(-)
MSEASTSGHFGSLPPEIQEDILLKLTASDLAVMERSSTHFRSVIMDGELWRRKADILGLRVVGQMEKEISILLENREDEVDCMFPIHQCMVKEQNEEAEAVDETDSDEKIEEELEMDYDLETDKESDEELNGKNSKETDTSDSDSKEKEPNQEINKLDGIEAEDTKVNVKDSDDSLKETIDREQNEDYKASYERSGDDAMEGDDEKESDNEDEIGESDNIKDEVLGEDEDIFRFFTHTRVSSRYDPYGHKVDCGMVVCQICLGISQQLNMNKEFRCSKCDVKTVLDDWKASVQIDIDKEVIRKVKLERILAKKTEGKYRIKKILKSPFPSTYWDMAIEEGMQEEEENEPSERGDCVVM